MPTINSRQFADKVLALLRQYGWEMGLRKLREEIAATSDRERRNDFRFFTGWMAAERGAHKEARNLFQEAEESPEAEEWSKFGQAFVKMRQDHYYEAEGLLATVTPGPENSLLQAAVDHLRGANWFHAGDSDQARSYLRAALRLLDNKHAADQFGMGRILDTFGMVYAGSDNFHAAEEFYRQAIKHKQNCDDQSGVAVSYGNLGRLYLAWGYLDKAEQCFIDDLTISKNILEERGEALMFNHLGQVALERGNQKAAVAQMVAAQEHWDYASGWLDSSIRGATTGGWIVVEAFAHKDRALLHLAQDQDAGAATEVGKAEGLFRSVGRDGFANGLAHINRVRGL